MNIAILGASHLTPVEEAKAAALIYNLIRDARKENKTIFTGDGEEGIDKIVRMFVGVTVVEASDKAWEGQNGYKARNDAIAQAADFVYTITTRVKNKACNECEEKHHQQNGGCWTRRIARNKYGKKGGLFIIE